MNPGLLHEDVQALLPAAALEMLENEELRQVQAHAAICADCARLLLEYREAAAALALQLPLRALDPARSMQLRARLTARARAHRSAHVAAPRASRREAWFGLIMAAGLAGVLLVHHSVHRPLDYGWLAAGVLALLLVAVGVYALAQRKRLSDLRDSRTEPAGEHFVKRQ